MTTLHLVPHAPADAAGAPGSLVVDEALAGACVLVLGLGASGLAMVRWCVAQGATVQVWDSRLPMPGTAVDAAALPPQAAALAAECPQAVQLAGPLGEAALDGVQLVLKSPGLAPHDERIAPLLAQAAQRGLASGNELWLFARALAALKAQRRYAPKVVAVTGTNGKTTTTAMAALLIERAGRRVATAGNIGPTMLDTLAAALVLEPLPVADAAVALAAADPVAGGDSAVQSSASDEGVAASGENGDAADAASSEATGATEAAGPDAGDDGRDGGLAETRHAAAATPAAAAPAEDDEAPLELAPPPPAAPVFEHLPEAWVLELSSFQLDGVQGFEPDAAAVLNLTQDHLDWHGSMQAYAEAKGRIFGTQALMVVNRDDPAVRALAASLQPELPGPGASKAARARAKARPPRRELRFGLDAPQRPGDFGLVVENGMAWLVRAHEADETLQPRRRGSVALPVEIHLQRLMPADALRVRGRHNAANALAALALAVAIGCALAPMLHALRDYRGEPHRVEQVATIGGIDAFDDSKGTNVGATVAAIDGLGADRAPSRLVVLLGGDGKGQDFAPLVEPLRRHARAVATIGRDAPAIEAAITAELGAPEPAGGPPGAGLVLARHATLEAATRWAFEQARPGDAVLLSPACASLDMFRNYAHRAEVFVDAVRELQAERGEVA